MNKKTTEPPMADAGRRRAAGLLARATMPELHAAWERLPRQPEAKPVRGPETGMIMVRGRIGGGGAPFNLGEATVTRATVILGSGIAGHAHALGTDGRKVRLAAIFDALLQAEDLQGFVESEVLAQVAARTAAEDIRQDEETAATPRDLLHLGRGDERCT